jgi:hypothetical protein
MIQPHPAGLGIDTVLFRKWCACLLFLFGLPVGLSGGMRMRLSEDLKQVEAKEAFMRGRAGPSTWWPIWISANFLRRSDQPHRNRAGLPASAPFVMNDTDVWGVQRVVALGDARSWYL